MSTSPSAATRRFLLPSLLIALLAGLLYLPGLPGEFVFDDYPNIVNNPAIQLQELSVGELKRVITTPQPSGSTRNLPNLTFALDYWRGGADPATFKSTNILIHALTAFALAWLFRSLLLAAGVDKARAYWPAAAMALAWAAHPLLVSSVLYVVQRLQTMGTLFLVLSLLAYLRARRAQIAGRPGRTGLLGTALLWIAAISCKEDAAALPAYTLALELTVLRFKAADPRLAGLLRRGYLVMAVAAAVVYFLWVVPNRWHWDAYPGRDFSTPERLLTQARVLAMYLGQIVLPLPSHMPFFYDWLVPSRGFLQPWTTLASIGLILGLLALAWHQRLKQPLLALGILLFFSAHFITSNVVGLELAYEHRNHFALIGALLAVGSVLAGAFRRLRLDRPTQAVICSAMLLALCGATMVRAHSWSSNLRFAQAATVAAPHSARAWIQLCAEYYALGGGPRPDNSLLDSAIAACNSGSTLAPGSLNSPALRIVLKTLRGDIASQDWEDFRQRMKNAPRSGDNRRAPTLLTYNARRGVKLDQQELLKVFAAQDETTSLHPSELASIGDFIMNDMDQPDLAMPYFTKAIALLPPLDPFPMQLASALHAKGRPDLAEKIRQLALDKMQTAFSQTT
ncbi:hypothetical protein [Luteimonas mephitis]|uniref:hypothetical protein n=1 Tax=Luteimonas mephitis TaxID=83615 RepID=UPI00146F1AE2|nr:hypothetical protein [Luteimonas mephitis]